MARTHAPSQSFDPALQELLRAGTIGVVRVPLDSEKQAIYYRARLNRLRAAMQKEHHSDWAILSRACCRIDPKEPTVLIVEPRDRDFRGKIVAAGVKVTPEEAPILSAYPDEPLDEEAQKKLTTKFLKSLRER